MILFFKSSNSARSSLSFELGLARNDFVLQVLQLCSLFLADTSALLFLFGLLLFLLFFLFLNWWSFLFLLNLLGHVSLAKDEIAILGLQSLDHFGGVNVLGVILGSGDGFFLLGLCLLVVLTCECLYLFFHLLDACLPLGNELRGTRNVIRHVHALLLKELHTLLGPQLINALLGNTSFSISGIAALCRRHTSDAKVREVGYSQVGVLFNF